jgi:hypothetical protein
MPGNSVKRIRTLSDPVKNMIKRVLIVFNAPPGSYRNVRFAARLTDGSIGSLHAVCVLDPFRPIPHVTNGIEFNDHANRSRRLMSMPRKHFGENHVDVTVSLRIGRLFSEIRKYVIDHSITQIIVEYPFPCAANPLSQIFFLQRLINSIPCNFTIIRSEDGVASSLHQKTVMRDTNRYANSISPSAAA